MAISILVGVSRLRTLAYQLYNAPLASCSSCSEAAWEGRAPLVDRRRGGLCPCVAEVRGGGCGRSKRVGNGVAALVHALLKGKVGWALLRHCCRTAAVRSPMRSVLEVTTRACTWTSLVLDDKRSCTLPQVTPTP